MLKVMQNLAPLFLLFFLLHASFIRHVDPENLTQLDSAASQFHDELTKLKETMTTLNSLSATQKQLVEEQRINEERMRTQHKQEEEREAARTIALTADHKLLDEIRGTVYRKIKYFSKNATQGKETLVNRPRDCSDLYLEGDEKSGVYWVWPLRNKDRRSFPVYCDMDSDGGGWTVIHRWKQPEVPKSYFLRSWSDYKKGFGDLQSGFWLGNELIYELTSQGVYKLRFVFGSGTNIKHSVYDSFFIAGEEDYYKLNLGSYLTNGTGGNILSNSDGKNFTTQDKNNLPLDVKNTFDEYTYTRKTEYYQPECARSSVGWWYSSSCEMDPKIHHQTAVTEMMIRQKWFLHKKALPP